MMKILRPSPIGNHLLFSSLWAHMHEVVILEKICGKGQHETLFVGNEDDSNEVCVLPNIVRSGAIDHKKNLQGFVN